MPEQAGKAAAVEPAHSATGERSGSASEWSGSAASEGAASASEGAGSAIESAGSAASERHRPATAWYVLGLSIQVLLWFLVFVAIAAAIGVSGHLTEFRYVRF